MKKIALGLLMLLVLANCQNPQSDQAGKNKNHTTMKKEEVKKQPVKKPEHPKMKDEELNKNVNENVEAEVKKEQKEVRENIDKAVEILKETASVVKLIDENKIDKAEKQMAKIVGELEILVAKDPSLSLIPVDVSYQTLDLVADIPTVEKLTADAREAMDKGYYQSARNILGTLASEIQVKTSYLPLATYPDAMKLAVSLLSQGKKDEAKVVLVKALNTLIIGEQHIPLPVLRAEEYIKAAALMMENKDKADTKEVISLLDNADYQLKLAEALGYGKRDKEYKELADAIEALKKAVENKEETKNLFDSLKSKINKFKVRLFFADKNTGQQS